MRGSILQTAGRYEASLEAYAAGEPLLELLDDLDPFKPLWNSCMGYVLYHLGVWQLSYDQLVRAMVERQLNPDFGRVHPDTLLARHNLGCLVYR